MVMCGVGAAGILVLRDTANLAVYVSLLTFVLGKWTGMAGVVLYQNTDGVAACPPGMCVPSPPPSPTTSNCRINID